MRTLKITKVQVQAHAQVVEDGKVIGEWQSGVLDLYEGHEDFPHALVTKLEAQVSTNTVLAEKLLDLKTKL